MSMEIILATIAVEVFFVAIMVWRIRRHETHI